MSGPRGKEWLERAQSGEPVVFDGGYGTMLFAAGLLNGACPELWNETHADVVQGIHRGYFEAGSDFVETNTFGGSRLKLNEYGIGDRTRELNERGARLVRAAAPAEGYVAGSVGPTSRLPAEYEPLGDTTNEEYFETFREQAEALAEGGVDLFAVETMMFPQEAVAAVRACKTTGLPVMATMFFQYEELHDRDRTMWGESPGEVAKNLLAAGADIVGMNCGRGPDRAITIIREMRAVTDAPLIAYPNAGLPITTGDVTTYELGPEAMAKDYPALLDAGAGIVGGCCGSGPEHIRRITLVQGSLPKTELLARHKAAIDRGERSVLFGLASLAEGVDLPGEHLTHVVVAKLPFAVPDSPLEEERRDWIESQGRSAFAEITLPEAGVRLQQAVGRLLRGEHDYGTVTILDRRLATARWGEKLLRGLPPFGLYIAGRKRHKATDRELEGGESDESIDLQNT